MLFSLTRAYTWEIGPSIDERDTELGGRSLREILMGMKTRDGSKNLFVGVDKKWGYDDGWTFTFGKKVQDEARDKITNLGPYLAHKYGLKNMEKWLTPSALERAMECTWDAENERVITENEILVDEALQDMSDDHWLFDLPKELEVGDSKKAQGFLPSIPSGDSVSTFNKTVAKSRKAAVYAPNFNPPEHLENGDGTSTMSSISGRVSKMETEMDNINEKLDKLLEIQLAVSKGNQNGRHTQVEVHVTPNAGGKTPAERV